MVIFYRKDVRLPQQLHRAMAAEAEAAREAKAKVTHSPAYVQKINSNLSGSHHLT